MEIKDRIASLCLGSSNLDSNEREFFLELQKEFKGKSEDKLKSLVADLDKTIEDSSKMLAVQKSIKSIVRLAKSYEDLFIISKLDLVTYRNIKSLGRLFTYIDKNHKTKLSSIRRSIRAVYKEGMEYSTYNNKIEGKIRAFRELYKPAVEEVVETKVDKKSVYLDLVSILDTLTDEDKAQFIEQLSK